MASRYDNGTITWITGGSSSNESIEPLRQSEWLLEITLLKTFKGLQSVVFCTSIMEEFLGKKYELVNHEHFNDLLIFLDINFLQRQVGMSLKPVQHLTRNDDGTYSIHYKTIVVTYEVVFTPGVEFIETKPDGVKVKAFITLEGNTIKHRQVEDNGRTLNHVYEFFPDKMVITTTGIGLNKVVKRNYSLVR